MGADNTKPNDADATVRREPDPDATVRREPEATVRRPAAGSDSDGTQEQNISGIVFPCEMDGKVVSLAVERRLGRGGEGELFLCTSGQDSYIVKILQRDCDQEVLAGMVDAQGELAGRHLVPCICTGSMSDVAGSQLDQRTYVIHPYYAGGDLTALSNLRRINPSICYDGDEEEFHAAAECYVHVTGDYSQVDEEAFRSVVEQMADALRTLHEGNFASGTSGVVHRDIKPQNIFVDEKGRYALGDFGLVSAMSSASPMKFTQRIGLSHGYSPPEAYSDRAFKQTVTRKYDYFSLGMTLLHIAGGRPRYIIDDDLASVHPMAMTLADFYETIMLSAVSVPAELPRRIRNLIRGLLAADPAERWGAAEVGAWLAGENPLVPQAGDQADDKGISLRLMGTTYQGARAAASALADMWDTASRMLQENRLTIDWDAPDSAYRREVEQVLRTSQFSDPDIALQSLILTIYRPMGHVFRGRRFGSDEALGSAMTQAAQEPSGEAVRYFTEMLDKGALSNAWLIAGGQQSDAQLRAAARLEETARERPAAALLAAGAMLTRKSVPPATIRMGRQTIRFRSARGILSWVRRDLEASAEQYAQPLLEREPPEIPGRWQLSAGASCVRQADGSVLLENAAALEPFPVSGELLALARFAVREAEDEQTRSAQDKLCAMLFTEGCIPGLELGSGQGQAAEDGFFPQVVIDFLALFPAVRKEHEMDDLLAKILRTLSDRLRYATGIRMPGAPAHGQRIDVEVAAVRGAVRSYSRNPAYASWAAAVRQAGASRAILAGLRPAACEAAGQIAEIWPQVMSATDPEVRAEFDKIRNKWALSAGDRQDIEELLNLLNGFKAYLADYRRSDLSPYLLSDTMLYIRNYNQTSETPLEIVLPDTTNAAQYYEMLTEQVNRKRAMLVRQGRTDEDGHVLRQAERRDA